MNIFEGAKFGDKFRTRDGRMAIYNGRSINRYWLIVERHPWDIIDFNSYGRHSDSGLEEDVDIVSEWQEPINEEEPDKLAIYSYNEPGDIGEGPLKWYVVGYKAGYRKAKGL